MQRIKEQGCISHFLAQWQALLAWLGGRELQHAIAVRIFDDTNVWVAPQKNLAVAHSQDADGAEDDDSPDESDPRELRDAAGELPATSDVGRQGKRKVSPLLGIVQRVFVRTPAADGAAGKLESAQIHVPSQVLPKAPIVKSLPSHSLYN